jgi:hypothetical protein
MMGNHIARLESLKKFSNCQHLVVLLNTDHQQSSYATLKLIGDADLRPGPHGPTHMYLLLAHDSFRRLQINSASLLLTLLEMA